MAGDKLLGAIGSGLGKLLPKGGVRNPDSVITQGSNRSLYIPQGGFVSPVPGFKPTLGKNLLTGYTQKKKTTDGLAHLRKLR